MQLGSRFQQLSVQRAAQIANRPQPQYDKYMGVAHAHAKVLDAAVADLDAQADTMHKQKADGEAFRGEQLYVTRPDEVVASQSQSLWPSGIVIMHSISLFPQLSAAFYICFCLAVFDRSIAVACIAYQGLQCASPHHFRLI